MATANTEKLVEALSELKVLELVALKEALEEKWGVSAAAVAVAAPAGGAGATSAAEEQTEFKVTLTAVDAAKKLAAIKILRELKPGLELSPAKQMVDNVPQVVAEGVSKEDAEKLKKQFADAGCTVTIA